MRKNRFTFRLEGLPTNIWKTIAEIDELKGQWIGGINLDPQSLGRLKKSVLITSTGASTRIEGAKMSDEDIEKLMKGISVERFSERDKQEVKGYFELLKIIFDSWKSIKFNESTIKHFHKELLKYSDKDKLHRGEYKKKENKVHMVNERGQSIAILFDTTPAYLTPKEMLELIEWTKEADKAQHPLLVIGNFLVEFLNIHPFEDGNGRLSRILTNLMMLQAGYNYMPYISHEKLIEDNKADYYLALRTSQKTFKQKVENIEPWLEFFLTVLLKQAKMAVALLSKDHIENILSTKQLSVLKCLERGEELSPREIAEITGISRPTVNQILNRLMLLKKIKRIGLGRATRYKLL